jgi:hypothetical protein
MEYTFSLTINDESQSFSPTQGLDYGDLGLLLHDLKEATDPKDGSICTLYKISNHGYSSNFITESELRYRRFIDVHLNIHNRQVEDLQPKEAKYARRLRRLLISGRYLNPYDMDNQLITTIHGSQIDQTVDSYYSVTTVTGVISQMGAPRLNKGTHVYLDSLDYKIYTSGEQDIELRPHYRSSKLTLSIRQKRSLADNRVINASLMSYRVLSSLNIIESLRSLGADDLTYWQDVQPW